MHVVQGSFTSVADASRAATAMLRAGQPLKDIWRFCLLQMLDDYESTRKHRGLEDACRMWRDRPPATGDSRIDAAFAALAEHLARRDGWAVPTWAREPYLEAMPWWFVTDFVGLHPRALVESPLSFRKRGVFITSGALSRA